MEDPEARMGTFSGGMIRKAVLARCLAFGAGFLTLDEPTNHLDLDTIEWLESLLRGASFGFLLVTHDRRFLDAVCTSIMEIESATGAEVPGQLQRVRGAQGRARGAAGAGRNSGETPSCAASWSG